MDIGGSKLTVCFPLPHFEMGGLERVQTNIAIGLIKAGIQTDFVTRKVDGQVRCLLGPEIEVRTLGGGRFGFVYRLICWLRKARPSAIITSANDIGCIVLLLRYLFWPDSKVVWTQHLSISGPLLASTGIKRLRLLIELWLMRHLVKRADAVIAVSQSVADDIRCMIDSALSVQVIYNPVVMDDFELRSREKIDWPWLDSALPTVIFVGRLARVKRIDLLLQAFALSIQSTPARLLIIGSGPDASMAESLVTKLDLGEVCRLVGSRDNPLPWIRKADLLVLCSDFEGFGLVLVEAMACGTQIVSTNCPHGPAELLAGGRYGRLVPIGDVNALASAISASLMAPRATEGELSARAAEFSVERAVASYMTVLKSVCA